ENVYLNSTIMKLTPPNGEPPFPGYYGMWDNTTWTFSGSTNPVAAGSSSATTTVVPASGNQGCVSWGAVIVSTTVKDDGDGLLNVWKQPKVPNDPGRPGYCDAAVNEGVCTQGGANWVDLPGAALGQKDVFVQLDYLCNKGNSN